MKKEISVRIAGEAGQGIATISRMLCALFTKAGFHIFANMDYMSRIRGGNNFFQIRISRTPVSVLREKVDILIPLNRESVGLHAGDCVENGIIFADKEKHGIEETDGTVINIPFARITEQAGGSQLYMNTAACGFMAGFLGIEFSVVDEVLQSIFRGKDEETIHINRETARAGYGYAGSLPGYKDFKLESVKNEEKHTGELLVDGNTAIALGAIKAGVKFYCAYPMTPSTSIMNTVAHFAHQYGILVEQAEDEIAAINMVIGASFAGVRTMAGTSGGGFALMQEGISLAGMTETPVVIVDSQRPGPATGLPTRTEQGDLNFLLHAGHGEFARVIFCPGTIEECYRLTIKAFQVADKYQVPVILMTDQHLADSIRNVPVFDNKNIQVQSFRISKEESAAVKNYRRYRLTDNGISPRAVPSWIEDVIYADSDEHSEEGHITESAEIRSRMMEKRFFRRYRELEKEIEPPVMCNTGSAGILLVGFGSTLNTIKEACTVLQNKQIGFIHLPQVWPFPAGQVRTVIGNKRVFTVENNAGAQLAGLVTRETGIRPEGSLLKYDGRPFNLDMLVREIEEKITI